MKTRSRGLGFDEDLKRAIEQYPDKAKFYKPRKLIKYAKALNTYPDLKDMPLDMVISAYDFRQAQDRHYATMQLSNIADARCDIQTKCDYGYNSSAIPLDLPALDFQKECIVCTDVSDKAIGICPDCWQLIRKVLELKCHQREGWTQWGYEMGLDLSPLVKVLQSDIVGNELLNARMLKEGKGSVQKAMPILSYK